MYQSVRNIRTMARPIEIDRDKAFRKSADLFWRRGYRATSLNDLLDATGMGKGSFYAAFGSKEELFATTLKWYRDRAFNNGSDLMHQGLAGLRHFLDTTLINIPATKRRCGCLLVNSVVELEGVEPELHRLASNYLSELETRCLAYIGEANGLGEINSQLNVEQLAPLTSTLLQGLRVDSRMRRSRNELAARIDTFIFLVSYKG